MNEIILIAGGILAGIINTLAGNGSVVTLSLCTEWIGLSPSIANGTNRLGILTQSISGTIGLHRHQKLFLKGTYPAIIIVTLGAFLGICIATQIADASFKKLYPWFLVFIFLVLILKPEQWLKPEVDTTYVAPWYIWPLYFLIGVYGGFIQLGVGVFFLTATIMIGKMPWSSANAAKIVVTGLFTIVAVLVFQLNGLFHLPTAIFLAGGQSIGAWLGVKYLNHNTQAHRISYYILLVITGLTIIKQFLFS